MADLAQLLKLLISASLCAAIGYDREYHNRPAGLRTHILVGLGATLFVILGQLLLQETGTEQGSMNYDPVRIIEAVITGVAFLGAGTIFMSRNRQSVSGLTTAASLWVCAGIGVAVASNHLVLAVGSCLIGFAVLGARPREKTSSDRDKPARHGNKESTDLS